MAKRAHQVVLDELAFRRLCTVQRWIGACPPNILRTALVSDFAPSTTTRVPPLVSRPALEQIGEQPGDHGRVLGVALIEATAPWSRR